MTKSSFDGNEAQAHQILLHMIIMSLRMAHLSSTSILFTSNCKHTIDVIVVIPPRIIVIMRIVLSCMHSLLFNKKKRDEGNDDDDGDDYGTSILLLRPFE